ncbi:MAG: hypothetical protein KAG96_05060 [Ichthyobacteriaceae bacterium]|nr:hypothetical protein [Ichthyobacteriaceae bacterium]
MSNKEKDKKANDHKSDMKNANIGTSGQNETHAQNQGNRGKQMNPNNKK